MAILLFLLVTGQTTECAGWRECRARALEAAGRGDFEAFHDLAWRAVQQGPPRDADLMYLVARAQSLSGRPADALVMIRRLAEMGVAIDAASNDDFSRVRALPGWPEVEAEIARIGAPPPETPSEAAPARAAPPLPPSRTPVPPTAPERPANTSAAAPSAPAAADAVHFEAPGFTAAGLGYDAVSRRFVVGDRNARKLFVVDEQSQRTNDLVGAASAGFHAIAGLAIDPRRGDLWVASVEPGDPGAAALHRLQLVSGRLLETLRVPDSLLPARFADVGVTHDGAILALDAAGRRIFRARPGSEAPAVAASLDLADPTSVAPAAGSVVYVSHAGGLARVDLASGAAAPVTSRVKALDLGGLERIRWRGGSLVAVQRVESSRRVVRLALSRNGRRVTAVETLDASVPASAAGAAAIAGDGFYYLVMGQSGEKVVRRVSLR